MKKIVEISKSTFIISLMYSVFLVFGKIVMSENHINFCDFRLYFSILLTFLIINFICAALFCLLEKAEEKRNKCDTSPKGYKGKNKYLIVFCIFMILWFPQWLAAFPGFFNYDATEIWNQYLNNNFIAQYPALYSIILVNFIKFSNYFFGSHMFGIATYVFMQMLISAGVFTYSIYIMNKYNISNKIKIAGIIYYVIHPAIYLYVLSFTKDSLFTIFLYLSILLYMELFKEEENFFKNKRWILLVISDILVILLRRNSIYVYFLFYLILILKFLIKGKNKIKILTIIILPIILSTILNNYFAKILNIKSESGLYGMLSVPVMQIAYVYNNNYENLTENQKKEILEIASDELIKNYNPEVSDSILYYMNTSKVVEESQKYGKLWLDIGKNNISAYLNAMIKLNYGYFYPDAIQKVFLRNDCYENRTFCRNWFILETFRNNFDNELIESLKVINDYIAGGYIQEIPIIKYIVSIGALLWILLFAISYSIYKKRKLFLYPSIIILLLLCTYILGPLVMARYMLILFYAFPLILAVLLNNEKFS
ncbi:MAG: hypothetical protein J6A36_06630 [Clostridia bacterium]|nr:hypothetical protein [Clostridia bacterium]